MSSSEDKLLAAAINKYLNLEKQQSFDPTQPNSKPNPKQEAFLKDIGKFKHRVIRAGNRSGKSSVIARELGWILNNNHPYWARPSSWGDGPILILIAGQDRKMMEVEIWDRKVALYLDLSEWRQVRVGGSLQMAENRTTGDKIVFLSHADSSDKNRKHLQGYTAQYVWLDEMPASAALFQEIRARASTNGYFVATFTPKFRSEEIRQAVDAIAEPYGRIYRLSMLDNPVFKGREDEMLAELEGYSEAYKRSVLYGDWYTGDSAVYEYISDRMEEEPPNYEYSWRHTVAVDPALKSKCGFTLWAECPANGVWYLVKDEYIEGVYDPEALFDAIEQRLVGYNIVRRITDNMAWFTTVASRRGRPYLQPYKKNTNRKEELVKNLQSALSSGKIKIAPWCTVFKTEIIGCQWAENADRIINASSYHTLDSSQYFVDLMPPPAPDAFRVSWQQNLRESNKKREETEKQLNDINKISRGRIARPISSAWTSRRKIGNAYSRNK